MSSPRAPVFHALVAASVVGYGLVHPRIAASAGDVTVIGTLHEVMHQGCSAPVAALSPEPNSRTYALGPLAALNGEFIVLDSVVSVSKPAAAAAPSTIRGAVGEQACLVVSASVKEWKHTVLDADVPFERLDGVVRDIAARSGVDVSKPFPFLIDGNVTDLAWHVIDGASGADREHDPTLTPHEAHRAASPHGVLPSAKAVLLGFYSTEHRGIFTHHDRDTHVHALVDEPSLVVHVDGVRLPKGTKVGVPMASRSSGTTRPAE